MMLFVENLENSLINNNLPIVSFYGFFKIGHRLYTEKYPQKGSSAKSSRIWDITKAKTNLKKLYKKNVLIPDRDFRSGVWRITQSTRAGSAEEVICITDPFAYISHLSAMQRYGLTNRSPVALHITTPAPSAWNELRDEKVYQDFPNLELPAKSLLSRYGFEETVRRRSISVHRSARPWTPVKLRGEETRITSYGQTFADMLREPHLCGGMNHVMDVWNDVAEQWVEEIVDAVNNLDSKIVKMRAGYMFSEHLQVEHAVLQEWEKLAQRGGSRKLDPEADYAPTFSERWMISLNV